jgi:hypothetical protein
MPRGYEDDYRRGQTSSARRVVDERRTVEEPAYREDRHREQRSEAREKTRIIEEPSRGERAVRSERDRDRDRPRRAADPDDMDYEQPRMMPSRGDQRANTAVRRQEERETITAYRDPKTGQLRDIKTHELIDMSSAPAPRPRNDYDDPMAMDYDDAPPRRRAERDREPDYDYRRGGGGGRYQDDEYDYLPTGRGAPQQSYNMNEYFIESTGIEREVLQHDLCKHLGNNATSRRYVKDVCQTKELSPGSY